MSQKKGFPRASTLFLNTSRDCAPMRVDEGRVGKRSWCEQCALFLGEENGMASPETFWNLGPEISAIRREPQSKHPNPGIRSLFNNINRLRLTQVETVSREKKPCD